MPADGRSIHGLGAIVALALVACSAPVPRPSLGPASHGPASPSASASGRSSTMASAATDDLVLLAIVDGLARIEVVEPTGDRGSIQPPPGEVRWIAADGVGDVVATTADGRILETQPVRPGSAWLTRPVSPLPMGRPTLSFAVPSQDGTRVAALSATIGQGTGASLAIVGPGSALRLVELPIEADGAAPAWLDDRRVIVSGLAAGDRAASAVVDAMTTAASAGPSGVTAFAISGEGSRLASLGVDRRTVEVGSNPWAFGKATPSGPPTAPAVVPAEPVGVATALSLDSGGRSLAVVWTDADLDPRTVVVYDELGGWGVRSRIELPAGTTSAALAWLPRPPSPRRDPRRPR